MELGLILVLARTIIQFSGTGDLQECLYILEECIGSVYVIPAVTTKVNKFGLECGCKRKCLETKQLLSSKILLGVDN